MSIAKRSVESPDNLHSSVEQEHYEGPHGAGTSYQKEYRTSFQTAGGAFTTKDVTRQKVVGLSSQSRSSLVNWDAGASSTPGFIQNQ